ncbi:hypothetical protein B0I35DRAFT_84227 [Stachybotrys elegans]|uniref:Uncharacterized protein n=1 Tax=Stachybotrys elegans TaxID=80388 RepID=A0A8K0SMF5_9HYPO|nr:hypothetical protein B0I35DRAFT_84227 [Stachybotrys elegans]
MWLCVLNCTSSQNYLNQYGILLAKASEGYYRRVHTNLVIVCNVLCDRFVDLPSNGLYQGEHGTASLRVNYLTMWPSDHTLVLRDMDDPQLKTINILTDNGPSSSFQETYYGPSDYYSYEFSDETDTRLCSMTWLAGVPRLQQPPLRQISDMRDVFGFEEGELPMMLYGIHVMKLTAAGLDASIMVVWGVVKDDSSLWTTWCLLFRIGTSSVRHRRYVFEPEKHSLKPREPLETDARVRDFWISLVSSEGDEFYEKDLDALQQLIRSRSILHPWVLLLTPDLELCATVRKTEGLGRVSYCIKFKISSIRTSPDSTTHVNNGSRAEKKRRRRLKQKPF